MVWQLMMRKEVPPEPKGGQNVGTELPEGQKVNVSQAEIIKWVDAFGSGQEPWRSDAVGVVRHERGRLDIRAEAQIREHGEYIRRPDGKRRTLVFALVSGLDIGSQKTVLLEEYPPGIWVPIETGPFFVMVDKTRE